MNTLRPLAPGQATDAELLAQLQRAAAEGAGMPAKAGQAGAAAQVASAASSAGNGALAPKASLIRR